VIVVLSMLESVLVSPEEVLDMMAKYQVPCPRPAYIADGCGAAGSRIGLQRIPVV
jgi:hypothetical protein